ncbi:SIMPL domain-containing protein [Actinoplanes sp. NPDC051851]|uniref:SIMPL domain-containing protein n=1 Tax=Actinoplanes sp. NPDC051851 TaxID=3154753 RepID=UPI00344237B2
MNKTRVVTSVVALASCGVLSSLVAAGSPALATGNGAAMTASAAADPWESVAVTGQGEVFGEPDVLTATFAVETTASTVDVALARTTAAATRVRDILVNGGVSADDLQTSNVDVSSSRNDNGKITGYTVTQGLTAEMHDLPGAGALMSSAIAAGGDAARINGVSFAIEDDSALLAEARKEAFADARAKAQLYAREAGRPLGRVVKVTEASPGLLANSEQDRAVSASMYALTAPLPIEPGRQELTATVTVEWILDPA